MMGREDAIHRMRCRTPRGVIPAMVFQSISDDKPIDLIGILVVLVTGMICFIPFTLFVRGVTKTRPEESSEGT